MEQLKTGKNPAGAQSRAGEAGANLSVGLGDCWPWTHKWGKWKDFEERTTTRNVPVLIQERRCSVCNKAQRRVEVCV